MHELLQLVISALVAALAFELKRAATRTRIRRYEGAMCDVGHTSTYDESSS